MNQIMQSDGETPLSLDVLNKALEDTTRKATRTAEQIGELQRLLAATEEEKRILRRLVALRRGEQFEGPSSCELDPKSTTARNAENVGKNPRHPAVDTVVLILEDSKSPVHISELMRLLKERNATIPGAGTQANLISHLRRDNRIVRPTRGMYALTAWGLQEMHVPARRRKKRRRARQSDR
jgi:hypothetical protein